MIKLSMKHSRAVRGEYFKHVLQTLGLLTLICTGAGALAEDFYRWVDEAGGVHYGSMPPQGVDAVKVKAYGNSGRTAAPPAEETSEETGAASSSAPDLANLPPEEIERRKKVAERQKEVCKSEQSRLEALNRPGRVRMEQEDGSYRYLSQDEVYTEIQASKKMVKENCQ